MDCPNEYTWSMYADGELEGGEAATLASHLNACAGCRSLAAALAEESRLLVHCLQDVDLVAAGERPAAQPSAASGQAVLRLGVFILLPAAMLRMALDALFGIEPPAVVAWLDPRSAPGQLNLFVNTIVYAFNAGGSIMTSAIRNMSVSVSAVALAAFGAFALARLFRRPVRPGALLALFLLAVFVSPGYAIDLRRSERGNGTVAADETVDDTLVFFGESITVDGVVTGDLIAFARLITVRGVVEGSVFSFGQRVEVSGRVEGSLLGFAQTIRVDGETARNLYGAAQSVTVGDGGRVGGDVVIGAQDGVINGSVGRDLTVGAASLTIGGDVDRHVRFGGQIIAVQAPARIGGNLDAHMADERNFQIDPAATILGDTDLEIDAMEPGRFRTAGFYIGLLLRFAAAFLAGLVLFWIFPPARHAALDDGKALLTAGGIGFLAAVATPVAAVLVGITLIGLPIALTAFFFWFLGLYLGKVVVALFIGRALVGSASNAAASFAWPLLAGLALVFVAINLPYIGGIVGLLVTVLGFGALLIALYGRWKSPAAGAAVAHT